MLLAGEVQRLVIITKDRLLRFGIELLAVNPAYTSVIGRMKYAVPYGAACI